MARSTQRYNIQLIFLIISTRMMIVIGCFSALLARLGRNIRQLPCPYSSLNSIIGSLFKFTQFGLPFFLSIFLGTFTHYESTLFCFMIIFLLFPQNFLVTKIILVLTFFTFYRVSIFCGRNSCINNSVWRMGIFSNSFSFFCNLFIGTLRPCLFTLFVLANFTLRLMTITITLVSIKLRKFFVDLALNTIFSGHDSLLDKHYTIQYGDME